MSEYFNGLTDEQRELLHAHTLEAVETGFSARFAVEMRDSIAKMGRLAALKDDVAAEAFADLLQADEAAFASEHPFVFRETFGNLARYVHASRINPDNLGQYSSSLEVGVIAGLGESRPVGIFTEDDLAFAKRALLEQREAGIPER